MPPTLTLSEPKAAAPTRPSEIEAVTTPSLGDAQQLPHSYILSERQQVKAILGAYPRLVGALLDALPQIEKFFGRDTTVALRVSCDQESDPILSANIQTALEITDARAARKRFNATWWAHQPGTDELPLTFNIEYL